ncbi:MAG: RluA family pseudouridine synthase [Bacteroidia bacterium]|nr:RluA family pseudouridine synthase [Bacteroidia bacterium]
MRLDKWLMHKIANASRTKVQAAIEVGFVLVNTKAVKSNYRIKPHDDVRIMLPEVPRDTEVYPENIPLNIIYEDSDLLIVNKPPGMVVHPGYNNYTGTLVNALVYHFKNLPTRDEYHRPGLVHRIDKDTSGLLVIAKTEKALTHLAKQFYDHSIHRRYFALVWGELANREGTITGYLNRDPADRRRSKNYTDPEFGKIAITHYKVLEEFYFSSLIECRLETGRTHQIRAHMSSIGHPIFSDEMYGGKEIKKGSALTKFKSFIANAFESMPRQALHAGELGFIHPTTGKDMFFEAPLPDDFNNLLEKIRKYVKSGDGSAT